MTDKSRDDYTRTGQPQHRLDYFGCAVMVAVWVFILFAVTILPFLPGLLGYMALAAVGFGLVMAVLSLTQS